MPRYVPPGFGWHRDIPDFRDWSPDAAAVRTMFGELSSRRSPHVSKLQQVDLREFFPEVYDQQGLDSSVAQACVGLLEYFEGRSYGRTLEPSRLFLYKNARNLLRVTGDTGIDLRTGWKAVTLFGMPPERYWPNEVDRLDVEPDPHLYSFASKYRGIRYVRLDSPNATGAETLEVVKAFLIAGFPAVFGFSVPNSISRDGDILFRPQHDSVWNGQAVIAVGFDDRRLCVTRGALLIRNSWGSDWGDDGYGWLPYKYVEEKLAVDFWTLLKSDWLETDEFSRPHVGQ